MIRRHVTPALVVFLVLLGCCLALPSAGRLWQWLLFAAFLPAAAGIVFLRASSTALHRAGLFALCACAGLSLGALSSARLALAALAAFLPAPAADISEFSGTLSQDSSLSQKGVTVLRLALHAAASDRRGVRSSARGSVLVFLEGDYRFATGEALVVRAPLAVTERSAGEQFLARVERGDVHRQGFAGNVWALRSEMRQWLHRAAARVGYPVSALLEALLIGSREDVPPDLYDGFKKTGSLHILALSGLHVTVIYGIIAGLLGFVRKVVLKFIIAVAILVFYQCLAGFLPSLLRATVMILVGGTALLLDRDAEPLNLLCISGVVILAADPFQAFSLSFQLSYLALAGILVLGPLVRRPLEAWVPRFILLPLAMSIGAQLATLPLVLARFGVYYPSGLVAGLLLVPLTTALLWAGLAWLPLFAVPWPLLHDLCARGFSLLYAVIEKCAGFFARAPGLPVQPSQVPWIVACSVLLLAGLAVLLPARRRAAPSA
jgi:competence protein ComEC